MKASEFIKKYGWSKSKYLVNDTSVNFDYYRTSEHLKLIEDIKKYIKAYELVESYGGLEKANKLIDGSYIDSNHDIPRGHEELSMAIQLVEECL